MTIPVARQAPEPVPAGLPWQVLDDYRCFGCSPHNPHGIQLAFTEHPNGLRTRFRLGRAHESYPGVVHGGLLGVICDETMGNLIVLRSGLVAFTTGMRMRYLAPVAVDATYTCLAQFVDRPAPDRPGTGDLVHTAAEIADARGELVATATASYRAVPFGTARDRIALSAPDAERLGRALSAAASAPESAVPESAAPVPVDASVTGTVPTTGTVPAQQRTETQ